MKDARALEAISYGLFVLSARQGDRDNGCVINTAMQATAEPSRVLFTVNKQSYTHDMVRDTGAFALSVLSQEADMALLRRFGFVSGREEDKFRGFEAHALRGDNGILYLTRGTNAWISGKVVSVTDLGTHSLFLADVVGGDVLSPVPSMTYAFYQEHIKPAPAAGASTKKRWVCKVCGYVYEGDFLPEDFICPLCKHPAGDFELLE